MLRSHLAVYKKTNNEVAIATIVVSGIRTRRRDTFFCSAKRKYPKKRRLDCRFFLRSSVLSGGGREGFLPSCRRTASMPCPFGLIPKNLRCSARQTRVKQRYCVTSVIDTVKLSRIDASILSAINI